MTSRDEANNQNADQVIDEVYKAGLSLPDLLLFTQCFKALNNSILCYPTNIRCLAIEMTYKTMKSAQAFQNATYTTTTPPQATSSN